MSNSPRGSLEGWGGGREEATFVRKISCELITLMLSEVDGVLA